MNPTYETVENSVGGENIKRTNADGTITWIPTDEANSDYQAFLKSLETDN